MKIITDQDGSLDDLVKKARHDPALKAIINGKKRISKEVLVSGFGQSVFEVPMGGMKGILGNPLIGKVDSDIVSLAFFNIAMGIIACSTLDGKLINIKDGSSMQKYGSNMQAKRIYTKGNRIFKCLDFFDREPRYKLMEYDETLFVKKSYELQRPVTAMCYGYIDSDPENKIYYACREQLFVENQPLTAFDEPIGAMCCYGGKLWFSLNNQITDERLEITRKRDSTVNAIVECDGVLYDAGVYGIYKTLENEKLVSFSTTSLIAVPSYTLENENNK